MARSSAVLNDAMNQVAISCIEAGLKQHKPVKEILEAIRREPAFAGVGRARLLRHWSETWRPMVAQAGRVDLPRRGGDRRTGAPRPQQRHHRPQPVGDGSSRAALEEMLDLVSAMLAESPDSPSRDAALRAFPGFVRTIRETVKRI